MKIDRNRESGIRGNRRNIWYEDMASNRRKEESRYRIPFRDIR